MSITSELALQVELGLRTPLKNRVAALGLDACSVHDDRFAECLFLNFGGSETVV